MLEVSGAFLTVKVKHGDEKSFFIILLEGHQTYSVYLATIWSQDYLDLEAQ